MVETVKVEAVRNLEGPANMKAWVKVKMFDHGRPGVGEKVKFLIHSGLTKSLGREEEWQRLRIPVNGTRKLSLKRNKTQFKTYCTG